MRMRGSVTKAAAPPFFVAMANVVNQEGDPQKPKRVPRKEDGGGYDCEFVEKPSDAVQGGECPVCLLVLKEPFLTECCGNKFCRVCIERVKKDTKPCPLCNESDFSFMQERALERYLKDLDVWCYYKKVGCEWRGKLGTYEQHLNKTPSSETQVIGCQFVEVECMYECGEWVQGQHITTHQTQQCKKRPYSCDYCRDYSSTFEEVITFHYPQCGKYPVDCPNKCREYQFERQELATHLKDECPLTLVNCSFHYAGCDVQIPRKDMCDHMKDLSKHLTLLASVTYTLMRENQDLRETMKKMNHNHRDEIKTMQDEMKATQQDVQEKLQTTQRDVQKRLQTTQQDVQKQQKDMQKKLATQQEILQQSVRVKLKTTQQDVQKLRTTQQDVQKLRTKQQDMQKKLQTTQQDMQVKLQTTQQDVQKLRATQQDLQKNLQTTQQDMQVKLQTTQQDVQATQKRIQTTQECMKATENSLTEKIEKLKLALTSCADFPKVYHVERKGNDVYLPGFYTHHNGYKMCIRVDPNGIGDGEGTHISIFTFLMKGSYDDHLKWPFRGNITIQIVNQAEDHDHIEMIVSYNDKTPDHSAGRVTKGERSLGWGICELLAHSNLKYNAIKKTQYLKDNHFIVRVVRVELM